MTIYCSTSINITINSIKRNTSIKLGYSSITSNILHQSISINWIFMSKSKMQSLQKSWSSDDGPKQIWHWCSNLISSGEGRIWIQTLQTPACPDGDEQMMQRKEFVDDACSMLASKLVTDHVTAWLIYTIWLMAVEINSSHLNLFGHC